MKQINDESIHFTVIASGRLDKVIFDYLKVYSRNMIQKSIRNGDILVDGVIKKISDKVYQGQIIHGSLVPEISTVFIPQAVQLIIVDEDEALGVINKPTNLVVHPGAGQPDNTVLNGLLYQYPSIINVTRCGIVHRLDKDTTGLMVFAKTEAVYDYLVSEIKQRKVQREYIAIVYGQTPSQGTIDLPIGRHPIHRTKMAVVPDKKESITHYECLFYDTKHDLSIMKIKLETGRTHQIRVHFAHIGFPLVGDPVYCNRRYKNLGDYGFKRQALHAYYLSLIHPITQTQKRWLADFPDDFLRFFNQVDFIPNILKTK